MRVSCAVAFLVLEHKVWGTWALVVAAHRLSCPVACGILVPRLAIPLSPALASRFSLTTGPPGKS